MAQPNKKKKPIWIYIFILFVTLLVSISATMLPAVQRIELSLRDRFFEIRGPLLRGRFTHCASGH
jgi:flagellar basal body-associated protein FliL